MSTVCKQQTQHRLASPRTLLYERPYLFKVEIFRHQVAKGVQPPGVDPRHQRVRSVSIILPKDVAFAEAAEDALLPEPGSAHATV